MRTPPLTLPASPAPDGGGDLPPGYEFVKELGRGGMGVVYLARQVAANRLVALKMLLGGEYAGAEDRQRFRRETQALAGLSHPHLVPLYEAGEHGGRAFYSMQFCEGGSLDERLRSGPLPPDEAADAVRGIAGAVQAAHEHGIVHRDLKPANVLLSEGTPKVTDFGLAKQADDDGRTRTGAILGTPSYMAPEQARSEKAGAAADVWALGAVLYALLTGRPPFMAANMMETLQQVVGDDPVPPARLNPKVPRDLSLIAMKCLRKEPSRRYGSARDLADDIGRWQRGEPITARPVSTAERVWKWCRRRPALASLLAVLAVGTAAAVGVILWLYAEARAAERRVAGLLEGAEWMVYANQLQLARREWESGRTDLTWGSLGATRWDFRGPEYRHLRELISQGYVRLPGHPRSIRAVAWHPEGSRLLTADSGGVYRVFGGRSGEQIFRFEGGNAFEQQAAYSPNGLRLATSCAVMPQLYIRDAADGRVLHTLQGELNGGNRFAWSPDGSRLVSVRSRRLVVWDAATGKELASHAAQAGFFDAVAWSPDGSTLAVASSTFESISLRDADTGRLQARVPAGLKAGPRIAWSPDGRLLAVSDRDAISLRDAATLKERYRIAESPHPEGVVWHPDGASFAAAVPGRVVKVWDARTGEVRFTLRGHINPNAALAWSPDGTRLMAGTGDFVSTRSSGGSLLVWDARGPRPVDPALPGSSLSPDGRWRASGDEEGWVAIHDARTGARTDRKRFHTGPVLALAWSPDGTRLATSQDGGVQQVWEVDGRGRVAPTGGKRAPEKWTGIPDPPPHLLRWSPDGTRIAGYDGNRPARIWDARTGEDLAEIGGGENDLAWSPDGRLIAVAGRDAASGVRIWDVAAGRMIRQLEGHSRPVKAVAFSRDGKHLVSGGEDRAVILWDVVNWVGLRRNVNHAGAVLAVCFNADGSRYVSRGRDAMTIVWAKHGQALLSWTDPVRLGLDAREERHYADALPGVVAGLDAAPPAGGVPLSGYTAALTAVAVDDAGQRASARDEKGELHTWDLRTGRVARGAPLPVGDATRAQGRDGRVRVEVEHGDGWVVYPAAEQAARKRNTATLAEWATFDEAFHLRRAAESGDAPFAAAFHLRRLIEQDPNDAFLHLWLSDALLSLRREQEAFAHFAWAMTLDPTARLPRRPAPPKPPVMRRAD